MGSSDAQGIGRRCFVAGGRSCTRSIGGSSELCGAVCSYFGNAHRMPTVLGLFAHVQAREDHPSI
eukprot:5106266-Pyramimonas_sp.AAC.1